MRIALATLLTSALLAATPVASAVPGAVSQWESGRFPALAAKVIEVGGVRVTNCHLEWFDGAAVPKCYVLNLSQKPADVRIDFVLVDKTGAPVISTSLSAYQLPDMTGTEFQQHLPTSGDEAGRVDTGRVRASVTFRP